ncbi:prostaglandin E receptor 1c (subtype EP1) [Solea solea]|uniref:prostaglandin E receptor 1c (subtype EP1) n=1 Tax=Solea solea TaxID=90069 RepID=UPI00272CF904|nr:prostaglandin E receptor 1c (subtype EP1) [Solea solea]
MQRQLTNMNINSSEQPNPWLNNGSSLTLRPSGIGMSCFIMTFGAISSLTALGILAKSHVRFRHQSKAPFLLLIVALLSSDLGGHVILGAFALYLHRDQRYTLQADKPTTFCQIFGMSMVFFGLCPLLLGCAMAVERCVAITQPFSHAAMFTVTHVQRVVLILSSVAFILAILPLFSLGTYTIQFPRTWCFLNIHRPQSAADTFLILAFSCLGLTALTLSLLCNILSGLVLLQARFCSHGVNKTHCTSRSPSTSTSSLFCSLDLEMMAQLAVITVVSCVCWSPFLIHILVMQINQSPSSDSQDGFTLLSLRMASWNQILDPWVYILLRRAVLFNCAKLFNPTTKAGKNEAHAFPHSTAHFHLTVVPSSHMTASSPTVTKLNKMQQPGSS